MSIYFIKYKIRSFLGLNDVIKPITKPIYNNSGPGSFNLDSWVNKQDHQCYQTFNSLSKKKKGTRPQVIFSILQFSNQAIADLSDDEHKFFVDQLLHDADVYFWNGRPDALEEGRIKSIEDFYETFNKGNYRAECKKEVQTQLSIAGLDPKKYLMLDAAAYYSIVREIKEFYRDDSRFYLDLDERSSPLAQLLPVKLGCRVLLNCDPQIVRVLKHQHPPIKRFVIDVSGMENLSPILFSPVIKEYLKYTKSETGDDALDYLELKVPFSYLPEELPRAPDKLRLTDSSRHVFKRLPDYFKKLKSLVLIKCDPFGFQVPVEPMEALEELRINYCPNLNLDLSIFPRLKCLIIKNSNKVKIDFKKAPSSLEILIMMNNLDAKIKNLCSVTSLRHLGIDEIGQNALNPSENRLNNPLTPQHWSRQEFSEWLEYQSEFISGLESISTPLSISKYCHVDALKNIKYLKSSHEKNKSDELIILQNLGNLQYLKFSIKPPSSSQNCNLKFHSDAPLRYLIINKNNSSDDCIIFNIEDRIISKLISFKNQLPPQVLPSTVMNLPEQGPMPCQENSPMPSKNILVTSSQACKGSSSCSTVPKRGDPSQARDDVVVPVKPLSTCPVARRPRVLQSLAQKAVSAVTSGLISSIGTRSEQQLVVGIFDPQKHLSTRRTDAPTNEGLIEYKEDLRYQVLRQDGKSVFAANLRLGYCDHISNNGFESASYNTSQPGCAKFLNESALLLEHIKGEDTKFLGKVTGHMNPGQDYPCPIPESADPGSLWVDQAMQDKVDFFYHEETQQYRFKLKPSVPSQDVSFTYLIQSNIPKNCSWSRIVTKENLLPKEIHSRLTEQLKQIPKLQFMLDSGLQLEDKINRLKAFCSTFKRKDFVNSYPSSNWLDILFAIISSPNPEGVCRHSAQIFVLLAHYLKVPAILSTGRNHQTALVPYKAVNGKQYLETFELGGGDRLDLVASELSKPLFENKPNESSSQAILDKPIISNNSLSVKGPYENYWYYKNLFEKNVQHQPLDFITLFTTIKPPRLIHLDNVTTPRRAHASLLNYVNQHQLFQPSSQQIIYIDHPADFKKWLKPMTVEGDKRVSKPGLLQQLIDSKTNGLVIVNWDNFTPAEAISFASILDTKPNLLGVELPETIQVLGLLQNQVLCDAFMSRCSHVDWRPPTKYKEAMDKPLPPPLQCNLHHHHDWYRKLVGSHRVVDDHIVFVPGQLLEAIHNNQAIEIINPPDSDDFQLFYHRLTVEKKLLVNAELIDFSYKENVRFNIKNQPLVLRSNRVHFTTDTQHKIKIHLSVSNFHSCFEEMTYDQNGKGNYCRGLLDAYNPSGEIFWVTGFIPQDFWAVLISEIEKKYHKKAFEFALAPGAVIEGRINAEAPLQTKKSNLDEPSIIFSNDTQLLAFELKEHHHASIIDVNSNSTLGDLLINARVNSDSDVLSFICTETDVYKKLAQGDTVIINGSLSQSVYDALSVFTKANGRFFWNGEWQVLPGKLIMVMPKEAKDSLILNGETSEDYDYNWEDYQVLIKPEDKNNFNKLSAFYNKARLLAHHGQGMPKELEFNWQRIQNVLRLLKSSLFHKANPIKEILLYDYPKDSEAYAYLNVLAKNYLAEPEAVMQRKTKLQKLIQDYKINHKNINNHAFRLLNTLSHEEISLIIGYNCQNLVHQHHHSPFLNEAARALLMKGIQSLLESGDEKTNSAKEELKTSTHFQALLEDEQVPLMVFKGEKGSGKSYTVDQIKSINGEGITVYSIDKIIDWLEHCLANKPGYALLNLEEFNLYDDETWNLVSGLLRGDKQVFYKGTIYNLTAMHKVVATGNPESFHNRHYHRLFSSAPTIYFKKPDPQFLRQIIFPRLITQDFTGNKDIVYQKILESCDLFDKLVPWQSCSYREYENICQRFNFLLKAYLPNPQDFQVMSALSSAIISELAYGIADPMTQAEFINFFPKESFSKEKDKVIQIAADFAIPSTRKLFYDMFIQDLGIREQAIQRSDMRIPYKLGVLIEGNPGIGKSRFYEEVLIQQGYSKTSIDARKKYSVINAGELGDEAIIAATEQLMNAASEGSMVILNELNLAPKLERLLNQLLCGKFPDGTNVTKGFAVFASQNSTQELGREAQSTALRSRFHMTYLSAYTSEELECLAENARVKNPKAFIQAYQKTKHATMRNFFNCMQQARSPSDSTTIQPSIILSS